MRIIKTVKRLDISSSADLEKELNMALEEDTDIVIDMSDTVYISSVILRALLKAQKAVNKMSKSMVITNVNDIVMEVFDITGFSGIFTFE